LVPGLQPVDVWPYQYPATYKDELERHSLLGTKHYYKKNLLRGVLKFFSEAGSTSNRHG
jgi:hypothetical protein